MLLEEPHGLRSPVVDVFLHHHHPGGIKHAVLPHLIHPLQHASEVILLEGRHMIIRRKLIVGRRVIEAVGLCADRRPLAAHGLQGVIQGL